jgi:hypothetical protein
VEPSAAEAVRAVVAHPEWLALPDTTVVVLGAGAEMGPLTALLRWGARVAGVDLPRPALWERVLDTARRGAGTLLYPVGGDARAGADLITEVPAVADWVTGLRGGLVLGDYVYADGATNVRVSTAVDALTVRLAADRDDLALAFLATPTDVFAVPADAVAQSVRAYAGRSRPAKLLGRPLRTLSAGGCCSARTCPAATPASSTAWWPSKGRTTRWPSGCSGGGRASPGPPGRRCR